MPSQWTVAGSTGPDDDAIFGGKPVASMLTVITELPENSRIFAELLDENAKLSQNTR